MSPQAGYVEGLVPTVEGRPHQEISPLGNSQLNDLLGGGAWLEEIGCWGEPIWSVISLSTPCLPSGEPLCSTECALRFFCLTIFPHKMVQWARDVNQVTEYLHSIHEDLG